MADGNGWVANFGTRTGKGRQQGREGFGLTCRGKKGWGHGQRTVIENKNGTKHYLVDLVEDNPAVQLLWNRGEESILDYGNIEAFFSFEGVKPLAPDVTLVHDQRLLPKWERLSWV
jgi:hypothetical protein